MADVPQDYLFRRLEAAEPGAGYGCLLDTCAWLEQRQIRSLQTSPDFAYEVALMRCDGRACP